MKFLVLETVKIVATQDIAYLLSSMLGSCSLLLRNKSCFLLRKEILF